MATIKPRDPREREAAYKLYLAGFDHASISAKTGIPQSTIESWASRKRWKDRKTTQELTDPKLFRKSKAIVSDATNLSLPEQQAAYRTRMAAQAMRFVSAVEQLPAHALITNSEKVAKGDQTARKALGLEQPQISVAINLGLLAAGSAQPAFAINAPAAVPALAKPQPAADQIAASAGTLLGSEV
jgi:hypothetical protein